MSATTRLLQYATDNKMAPQPISTPVSPSVAELRMCSAETAVAFEQLIVTGDTQHLSTNTGPEAQAFKNAHGGAATSHMPVVPALVRPEDPHWLHPRVLRAILHKSAEDVFIYPPLGSAHQPEAVALDLINHLEDMEYFGEGSSAFFHSPAIDQIVKQPAPRDEVLSTIHRDDRGEISIVPSGAVLRLALSISSDYTEVHVITGVRIYVVWPPTPHNLDILQQAAKTPYNSFEEQMGLCQELKGGVTFVQRPGHIVYLPPDCPAVIFASKMSAAVEFYHLDIGNLPSRLRYIDLACDCMEILNPGRAFAVKRRHVSHLYKDLSKALRAFGSTAHPGAAPGAELLNIRALGEEWNRSGPKFRDYVEYYLSSPDKDHVLRQMPRSWREATITDLVTHCPMCQSDISELDSLDTHFEEEHWSRTKPCEPANLIEAVQKVKKSTSTPNSKARKLVSSVASANKTKHMANSAPKPKSRERLNPAESAKKTATPVHKRRVIPIARVDLKEAELEEPPRKKARVEQVEEQENKSHRHKKKKRKNGEGTVGN
jgi:hypothetical protein